MAAKNYYEEGAKGNLPLFFSNSKRLELLKSVIKEVENLQQIKPVLDILDLGAGVGMHANYLAKMNNRVVAVDCSSKMLAEGKKLFSHDNLLFIEDSLPALENIPKQQFDIIYSIATWQYIDPKDRQKAMERCKQLLRPGGSAFICWPIPMSREFQHPLSEDELLESINLSEASNSHDNLAVSRIEPIVDPDGRFGILDSDKEKAVYFHTLIFERPIVELKNELENTKLTFSEP